MSTNNTSSDSVISTELARRKLDFRIQSALLNCRNTLIDAPTSLGKTYLVATTAWRSMPEVTGDCPVVHLHGTKAARDEAAQESRGEGVAVQVLKSGLDTCPVAQGEFDSKLSTVRGQTPSKWLSSAIKNRGYTSSEAHQTLSKHFNGLPCANYDDGCPSRSGLSNRLTDEDGSPEYDVIHATHEFAHMDSLVEEANVVFDERPSFTEGIRDQETILRRGINELLDQANNSLGWNDLVQAVREENEGKLTKYRRFLDEGAVSNSYIRYDHKNARAVAKATTNAEPQLGEKRYIGRADGIAVVLDGQGELREIHRPPDLSQARCVVGLDAHPSFHLWQLNTVEDLELREVLSDSERQAWRRHRRGLQVTQIGDDTRSYTLGWRGKGESKAERIIRELRHHYGSDFRTAISSQATHDDVEMMLSDVGIDDSEQMYFGNLKSQNTFRDESVGLVVGCIDPGDERILDDLAVSGLDAWPKTGETESGEEVRKTGRLFSGPDREAATEFLQSVREREVAQAVGRYARNPETPAQKSLAVVFVWTSALPTSFRDEEVPGRTHRVTSKKREIANAAQQHLPVTVSELTDGGDWSRETVRQTLNKMVEQGIMSVEPGAGYQGANEYSYEGGELLPTVDLGF